MSGPGRVSRGQDGCRGPGWFGGWRAQDMWLALGGGRDSQGEVSSDAGRGQRWAGSWPHGPDASCSEERESHLGTEHALQPPGSRRARCRETKLNLQEPDLCWKVGSRGHTHCPPPPFTTAHLPPRESLAALTSSSQCRLSNKQSQQRQNAGGLAAPSRCPAGRARILLLF